MTPVFPVTIYLAKFDAYESHSLLEVLQHSEVKFLNQKKTLQRFACYSEVLYYPLFEFLYQQRIHFNLVISGDFIVSVAKNDIKFLRLLKKMFSKKLINLVADAYYSNSLTCLYNTDWWLESICKTREAISQYLGINSDTVFIPQLYRALELEKVCWDIGITRFLCREKRNRPRVLQTTLSDLRRFDGQNAYWITPENDIEIEVYFVPDNQFYEANNAIFGMTEASAKILGLEIALGEAKRVATKKQNELSVRLNEHYSLALYNQLQRSVIRLWEYGSVLIYTQIRSAPNINDTHKLRKDFARLQNVEFLRLLRPNMYSQDHNLDFTSPYEAFASMQAAVKKVEITLQNKI